jgi:XTP/dITP diphosphohydrolase
MTYKSKLLVATHNPAKLSEIQKYLSDLGMELITLNDLGITEDVEEDGKTFEENAIKKAKYFAKRSGLPTVSDDGGVEIDYLNGEPGIHSRRWIGGKPSSDEDLINHALKLLIDVRGKKRAAQLRAVIALVLPSGEVRTSEGKIRGIIAEKPYYKRWKGFPYRSLFYIPGIKKFYNPEDMNENEDIKYNHRRHALKQLKNTITRELKVGSATRE